MNKKAIYAAVASVMLLAAGLVSVRVTNTARTPAVRVGVAEGVPYVIMKEAERLYGSQSIVYDDMSMYSFQDC